MARVLISKTSITGEVKAFAGISAPEGYLFCNGQAISRTVYAELFAVLGTSYGTGNGTTTFNLPDYRGTFLRGRVDIATVTGSGSVSLNNATFTNHSINRTGFKVRLSSGTLSGLAVLTDYYAIVIDNNTLAFATSLANAIAGTKTAISGVNSAIITQYEDPDASSRVAATVGGNSAGGLGSVQDNQVKSHFHRLRNSGSAQALSASRGLIGGSSDSGNYIAAGLGVNFVENTGGEETRPQNSLINYIIKY